MEQRWLGRHELLNCSARRPEGVCGLGTKEPETERWVTSWKKRGDEE
jgi:hypothetical protein